MAFGYDDSIKIRSLLSLGSVLLAAADREEIRYLEI